MIQMERATMFHKWPLSAKKCAHYPKDHGIQKQYTQFKNMILKSKIANCTHLARSSLRHPRSCEEVSVVAWVKWECWKSPVLMEVSTAFLHRSSRGTLTCAPISFSATSDPTLIPRVSTRTQVTHPSSCEGNPIIWTNKITSPGNS